MTPLDWLTGLYEYLQGIQAYLAPPIAAVFFFGVFMKRLTAAGCLAALWTGFALGMIRLLVDTPVTLHGGIRARVHSGVVALDTQPWDVLNSAVVLLLIAAAYLYFNG
jgi:SSS family solute:Na+ symporter